MSALSYTLLPNRAYYIPQPLAQQVLSRSYPYLQLSNPIVAIIEEEQRGDARAQRIKFLLFVKILFKRLRDSRDFYLLARAQLLVRAVTRRNKMGDPNFHPLLDSMERRLRELVGEVHWRRSHAYMRYYIQKHGHPSAVPARAAVRKQPANDDHVISA
jgi:hypothetical protein